MHSNNKAKLRSILTELLKVKDASSKIGKQLIKQTQELIRKENIYLQLKTELNYHLNLNYQYKQYLELLHMLTLEWKKSKAEIEYNTKKFKEEFKEFVTIIEGFDEDIRKEKENNKTIIQTSEEIIILKYNEQKKLNSSLNDFEAKIKNQSERIDFLKNENIRLKAQKDEDYKHYMTIMDNDEKKYNLLHTKYEKLQKMSEIFYNEHKDYLNPYLRMIKDAKISNQIIEDENKQIELNEKVMQHENLLEQVKEMSFRITKLSLSSTINNTRNNSHQRNEYYKKNYTSVRKRGLKKSGSTFF